MNNRDINKMAEYLNFQLMKSKKKRKNQERKWLAKCAAPWQPLGSSIL
jgi:hypothetical protein